MGKKIFISYKYADNNVKNINGIGLFSTCTVRDYVDKVEEELEDKTEHIYKGESDGEDLSQLSEDTIWDKLRDRIYDSTLTIVMVSKGMRENFKEEKHQWIPREISYSLKETSRKNKNGDPVTSKTNALLAVILPDLNGDYDYFVSNKNCCDKGCICYNTASNYIFSIMKNNMFNVKNPDKNKCDSGDIVYHGECNYMKCVKWDDFIDDMEKYIDKAYDIQDNQDNYNISKEV